MTLRTHHLPVLLPAILAGCSAAGLRVKIVDADTLALNGEELGWSEFEKRMLAEVERATSRGAGPPPVLLQADPMLGGPRRPAKGDRPIDRILDLLQRAGVRDVRIGH